MTKRAFQKFERNPRDFYGTPDKALGPLAWHLRRAGIKTFAEPCCGRMELAKGLESRGFRCVAWGDLEPDFDENMFDARTWGPEDFNGADAVITNTPWEARTMHGIMEHLSSLIPCWFITYWDWLSTHQSSRLVDARATDVVPIGRLKWIQGSPSVGFDNAVWVRMEPHKDPHGPARLWPMWAE